jgi:hypothetical protein
MVLRLIATALLAWFALSGVAAAQSTPGFVDLLLTNNVKIGHVYFAGSGKRPAFITAKGNLYSELCYEDYSETQALAGIGQFVEVGDPWILNRTIKRGGGLSFSVAKIAEVLGQTFGIAFDASVEQTYIIKNVRRLTLKDEGIAIVRSSLGANCQAEIAKMQQQNIIVVLAVAAERADEASESATTSGGFVFPWFPVQPHGSDVETTIYGLTYVSASLAKIGPVS